MKRRSFLRGLVGAPIALSASKYISASELPEPEKVVKSIVDEPVQLGVSPRGNGENNAIAMLFENPNTGDKKWIKVGRTEHFSTGAPFPQCPSSFMYSASMVIDLKTGKYLKCRSLNNTVRDHVDITTLAELRAIPFTDLHDKKLAKYSRGIARWQRFAGI